MSFTYRRNVAYYETDAMGVVHHSNYLRLFEDARIAWLREKHLISHHAPYAETTLAVLESECKHHKPAFFGDELIVQLQVKLNGLKVCFRYAVFSSRAPEEMVAYGATVHVPLDKNFKVTRLAPPIKQVVEKESWTETWP